MFSPFVDAHGTRMGEQLTHAGKCRPSKIESSSNFIPRSTFFRGMSCGIDETR